MPHDKTKSASTAARNVSVPRFKGKTTFEIFENGKKVSEHTDTNMMTNMLQNIFSPPRLLVDGEYCRSLYLNNMPMYSKVLGGILLYEQRIEENADMCLAPVTNRCVGHAGSAYSGTLSTRGSLNETESGFLMSRGKGTGWYMTSVLTKQMVLFLVHALHLALAETQAMAAVSTPCKSPTVILWSMHIMYRQIAVLSAVIYLLKCRISRQVVLQMLFGIWVQMEKELCVLYGSKQSRNSSCLNCQAMW